MTYIDIADDVAAGKTADEIAAERRASGLTHRDMDVTAMRTCLDDQELLSQEIDDGRWIGPVADAWRSESTSSVLRDALGELLRHLRNNRTEPIRTKTDPDRAKQVFDAIAGLVSYGYVSAEQRTAVYEIAGGERYADLTAEQVQAVIDEHAAEEQRQELQRNWADAENEFLNPAKATNDRAAIVAAYRAVADAVEAGGA